MKVLIDNLDGLGPLDYTAFIDSSKSLRVSRKLNSPSGLKIGLVAGAWSTPVVGGRILVTLSNGANLFTGYVLATPTLEYVGWADRGPTYRYEIDALSDVMLLDQKAPPPHPPFVNRNAGSAFDQLATEALPGWYGTSGVQAGDAIPYYSVNPARKWTAAAADIALSARCAYRDDNNQLLFSPLTSNTYTLTESAVSFSPGDLQLQSVNRVVNDLTILGPLEPGVHVKDYFVGDGVTTYFYLSEKPFTRSSQIALYNRIILDETYVDLDATHWIVTDPTGAISVSNAQLFVAGGSGVDGQTLLRFIEQVELGGATMLEHGDFVFNSASDGVIGGLYAGTASVGGCLAGFRITPSGSNCNLQALVEGSVLGTPLLTQPGHRYVFTTRLYPIETYRMQQVFHSSVHPSGAARGGSAVASDVRVVLTVHDIDPTNPATQVAAATVLYDGLIANAPGFCTYALINAGSIQCSVAFTYLWLPIDALVRSTMPQASPATVLTGSLLDGAACQITTGAELEFYAESIPPANELLEVSYRGQSHAMARVTDAASIASHRRGGDDGVRGDVREIGLPVPRTSADCEIAALALLDDAVQGWSGEYQAWSQFLPGGAADIFPGDGLAVNIPSRVATFTAIVREVDVEVIDVAGETSRYTLRFVDAGDPSLDFAFVTALMKQTVVPATVDVTEVGDTYLADLTKAEVADVGSTTVTVDIGFVPVAGGGIEARYSDEGWGQGYSGNLIGRYASESFTMTRFARAQDYYLKSYDGNVPPRYSRYATKLHVDYPL